MGTGGSGHIHTISPSLRRETNRTIMRTLLPLRIIYKRWKPSSRNHPLTLRMYEYCFHGKICILVFTHPHFIFYSPFLSSFERNATSQGKTQQRHG